MTGRRSSILIGVLTAIIPYTYAMSYWIEYDGGSGTYPETQGWTRYAQGGGGQRWFQDSSLVLDTRADPGITEAYAWYRPSGHFDPGPGEWLTVSWRLRIDDLHAFFDPTVGIYSDTHRALGFDFRMDTVYEASEGAPIASFEPGLFQTFAVRSADVFSYDFYVDGVFEHSGHFWTSVGATSFVSWGSNSLSGSSLTDWSTVNFGVVPEPFSFWLALAGSLVILKPRG
jgi:hypothetical protein